MDDEAPGSPRPAPEVAGLTAAAKEQDRSMSALIRRAVTEYLDEHYPLDDATGRSPRRQV